MRPRSAPRASATSRCRTTSAGFAATCSDEGAGTVGTVCIYEATSEEALRRHASLADLPVDEIIPVADTVIVRPDPQAAAVA